MDTLTDAELVSRLKLVDELGTAATATKLGVSQRNVQMFVAKAKAKGLNKDSVIVDPLTRANSKIKVLEGELASIKRDNITAAEVRDTLYGLSAYSPEPPTWLLRDKHKSGSPVSVPVVMWSDFHWGEVVSAEEVGGVNSYNRAIAKKRLRTLVNVTIELAVHHMVKPDYPGIVVCLGGDLISGNIHDELTETNDGPVQQSILEVQEELIAALTQIADTFGKVFVPCVVGNHGRNTLKPRMKNRVYQSYEWNIYCQLERWFKAKGDKRVQFLIPGETDAHFSVLGHRFLLTHGDTLGVKGGDGIIGAIGPIARGTTKVGRSEAQIGRDFDTLLMGHYHTYIPRGDAVPVIVNGALKGYDEYARLMLRVPYARPSQALFFVNAKYGITAQWAIYLEPKLVSADTSKWVSWEERT